MIEDYLARGGGGVIAASFRTQADYRREAGRWRELARRSRATLVFSDFRGLRVPPSGPAEIPLPDGHPLLRTPSVAWEAPGARCYDAFPLEVFLDAASEQLPRLVAALRLRLQQVSAA